MRNLIPLAALLLALSPFACVKETVSTTDSSSSIHATVLFPPNVSCTDAHWIQVRGSGSGNFDSLEVDGVNATSSDGFLTWVANVPLDKELNTLTVVGFRDGQSPDFNLDSISVTKDPLVGANIKHLSMTDQ